MSPWVQRAFPGTPKVSVVVQTYNHEPFIAQAIEGVLMQRVSFPVELILADDASTDGTRAKVQEYGRSHPDRIRLVLPESNLGANEMFVRALAEARGDYVAFLEGDDYWTSPYKLSRQVALLDERPDWAGCFHGAALVYGASGHPHQTGYVIPNISLDSIGIDELLSGVCFLPGPAWMHRRSSLAELPPLEGLLWSDWLIHIAAARHGALGYIDEVFAAYRVHEGGAFNGLDRTAQLEEDLKFYERAVRELPSHDELIERCIADRRCQLGVESARLPYDAPLLVLDPDRDLPLYFNGRFARAFPDGNGSDREETLLVEFDRVCEELAQVLPCVPDARPREEPVEPGAGRDAFLVLPRAARPWFELQRDLAERVGGEATQVFEDEWCSIYRIALDPSAPGPQAELPTPLGGATEVVGASRAEPLPGGLHASLDVPKQGESVAAHAVYVVGWVMGEEEPAEAVEFELDGELIGRTPPGGSRPDLAEAYGDKPYAMHAGFSTIVNVAGAAGPEIEVHLFAVMPNGARLEFGKLCLRS